MAPANSRPSAFSLFMASHPGRALRMAMGIALVIVALTAAPWPFMLLPLAIGTMAITTGVFNLCPIAPLWGGHFSGARYCAARRQTR